MTVIRLQALTGLMASATAFPNLRKFLGGCLSREKLLSLSFLEGCAVSFFCAGTQSFDMPPLPQKEELCMCGNEKQEGHLRIARLSLPSTKQHTNELLASIVFAMKESTYLWGYGA